MKIRRWLISLLGLRFTDAHSTAATCTPSRYSVMTGLYAWRKKGTGVLQRGPQARVT